MQWAMSPAVRARIGTARMSPGGTSTSRSVAAIDIETFIGSGLPQVSAAALVRASAASTERPAIAALARERDHALGARIDGLVQRMAISGERLAFVSMFARDVEGRDLQRAATVDASQNILDQLSTEVSRAQNDRAAAKHAGGDGALKRRGIGVVGHARRLDRRRQAMLGERDQAQIKKEALLFGRRPASRQKEDIVGETRAAHQVIGEVAASHDDPIARRRGDRGSSGPRLADQHGVPFPPDPFASHVRRMGVGRL